MRKMTLSALVLLAGSTLARAQHLPRGAATDVANAEIQATVQKTASAPVSDQAIRVVSINDEYNVGIGVVHRAKTAGRSAGGAIEHSQITEVYHVIEGNATLVTGGVIENPRESPPESTGWHRKSKQGPPGRLTSDRSCRACAPACTLWFSSSPSK
jgi:hypothetical protein